MTSPQFSTGVPRYLPTISAGGRTIAGVRHRFGVWDRRERRIASWHRTRKQATAAAKRLNATDA